MNKHRELLEMQHGVVMTPALTVALTALERIIGALACAVPDSGDPERPAPGPGQHDACVKWHASCLAFILDIEALVKKAPYAERVAVDVRMVVDQVIVTQDMGFRAAGMSRGYLYARIAWQNDTHRMIREILVYCAILLTAAHAPAPAKATE